jgi:Spy/CpxP family protein refolding chaperone
MYTLRKTLFGLAVLVVCVAIARPAETDEQLIAREDAVEVMLLRQKSVQDDLKLTPVQGKKIHEFANSQWKKVRAMKDLSKDERDRRFEGMAKENERFIKDNLNEQQRKRLHQIAMHVAGLLWVLRSDVAQSLNLTDEQKSKLREAHREAHKEAMETLRSAGDTGVKEEKFHELRGKNRKQLMSVLNDEQKAKWREMAGPPFRGELHFGPRAEK